MHNFLEFEVVVTYSTGTSVHRGIPIASGFQPLFCFDEFEIPAEYGYPFGLVVYPGDSVRILVKVKASEHEGLPIYSGMSFVLKEAGAIKGEGTVKSEPSPIEG